MDKLIKQLKKESIFSGAQQQIDLDYGQEIIKRIIPHREPFLLVDKITDLDIQNSLIKGERIIRPEDPVFQGHFPGNPIYPGVLQIEIVAQLGLCLSYFTINNTTEINNSNKPVMAMVTKIIHAAYCRPILPNQQLNIQSKILDYNEIMGTIAGQIFYKSDLCSYFILEAYFND